MDQNLFRAKHPASRVGLTNVQDSVFQFFAISHSGGGSAALVFQGISLRHFFGFYFVYVKVVQEVILPLRQTAAGFLKAGFSLILALFFGQFFLVLNNLLFGIERIILQLNRERFV